MLARLVRESDADPGSPVSSSSHSKNHSPVGTPPKVQNDDMLLVSLVRDSDVDAGSLDSASSHSTILSPIGPPKKMKLALLVRDSEVDEGSPGSSPSQSSSQSPIGTPARRLLDNSKQHFAGSIWLSSLPESTDPSPHPPIVGSAMSTHTTPETPAVKSSAMTSSDGPPLALLPSYTYEVGNAKATMDKQASNGVVTSSRKGSFTHALPTLHELSESGDPLHSLHSALMQTPSKRATRSHVHSTPRAQDKALSPTAQPYQPLRGLPDTTSSPMNVYAAQYQQVTPPSVSTMSRIPDFDSPDSCAVSTEFTSPLGCSSGRASRPDFQSPQGYALSLSNASYSPGALVAYHAPPKFNPAMVAGVPSTPAQKATANSETESPQSGLNKWDMAAVAWMMAGDGQQGSMMPLREDVLDQMVHEINALKAKAEKVESEKAEKQMQIANLEIVLKQAKESLKAAGRDKIDQRLYTHLKRLEKDNEKLQAMLTDYYRLCLKMEAERKVWEEEKANIGLELKSKDQKIEATKAELDQMMAIVQDQKKNLVALQGEKDQAATDAATAHAETSRLQTQYVALRANHATLAQANGVADAALDRASTILNLYATDIDNLQEQLRSQEHLRHYYSGH